MDSRTKALLSGGTAFVLAMVIILSATFLGFAPIGAGTLKPSSTGALSIMLSDPPSIPDGVTAVFITYSGLRIHAAGFPSASGWVELDSQGTVEAIGLANLTQTITSTDVPSGTYDYVAFNILSSEIEYQDRNFSATVHTASLEAPFVSSLDVSPSSVSTALVDLQSTVLNLGSGSSPQFLVNTAAKAVEVPSDQVQPQSQTVGSKTPLPSSVWYANFTSSYADHLTLGSVSLTSHSLSLVVNNPSRNPVAIRLVVISPAQTALHQSVLSPLLVGSAVFEVGQNGSLRLLQLGNPGPSVTAEVQTILGSQAFQLPVGASATFTYEGTLKLSSGVGSSSAVGTPAGLYAVTIIGNQVLAGTIVKLG